MTDATQCSSLPPARTSSNRISSLLSIDVNILSVEDARICLRRAASSSLSADSPSPGNLLCCSWKKSTQRRRSKMAAADPFPSHDMTRFRADKVLGSSSCRYDFVLTTLKVLTCRHTVFTSSGDTREVSMPRFLMISMQCRYTSRYSSVNRSLYRRCSSRYRVVVECISGRVGHTGKCPCPMPSLNDFSAAQMIQKSLDWLLSSRHFSSLKIARISDAAYKNRSTHITSHHMTNTTGMQSRTDFFRSPYFIHIYYCFFKVFLGNGAVVNLALP